MSPVPMGATSCATPSLTVQATASALRGSHRKDLSAPPTPATTANTDCPVIPTKAAYAICTRTALHCRISRLVHRPLPGFGRHTRGLHQAAQRTCRHPPAIMTVAARDRTCATPSVLHRLRSRRDRWRHPLFRAIRTRCILMAGSSLHTALSSGISGSLGAQYTHGSFSAARLH